MRHYGKNPGGKVGKAKTRAAEEIKNIHWLSLSILQDQLEKDGWMRNGVEMEILGYIVGCLVGLWCH